MTTSTENIESEIISFDSNQISSDEQLSQIIDSINLSTSCEDTNNDEKSSSSTTVGQTAIGVKLVKNSKY